MNMAFRTMPHLWSVLSVVIVVLIPLFFAEETKIDGKTAYGQPVEELLAKFLQEMDIGGKPGKVVPQFPQDGAEGKKFREEFMSQVLIGRAKGKLLMGELISRLSQGGAEGENLREELKSKLSQAGVEENKIEKLMSKLSQGGADGKNLKEEFMSKLSQGETEGKNIEESLSKLSQGGDGQNMKEFISKLSQGGAKGKTYLDGMLDVFADMILYHLHTEQLKKLQGLGAGGHPLAKLISTVSQKEGAIGNTMQELLRNILQIKSTGENPLEKELMGKILQGETANGSPVSSGSGQLKESTENIKYIKASRRVFLLSLINTFKDKLAGYSDEEMSMHKLERQKRHLQWKPTENIMEKTPQAEKSEEILKESSHGNYYFNSVYSEVVTENSDRMDHSLKETVVPLFYKIGYMGSVLFTTTTFSNMKRMLGYPIPSSKKNIDFINSCEKIFQENNGLPCSQVTGLLYVMGMAATTAGHLSQAYVRTMLFGDSENIKNLNNEIFRVVTQSLCSNLVMLKHLFKMAVNFKDAVSARYLQGNVPVSGTEQYFAQASDELYASVTEYVLVSNMTQDYYQQFVTEMAHPLREVSREFHISYKEAVWGGIPHEYKTSPFPALSYYWDMAALQYVVSVLAEIEGFAQRKLQEQKDDNEGLLVDKMALIKAVGKVHELLTQTGMAVKKNSLQTALKLTSSGISSLVSNLQESGIQLRRDEETETLSEVLMSTVDSIPKILRLGIDGELSPRMLSSLIPSSYNQVISMVNELHAVFTRSKKWLYTLWEKVPSLFYSEKSFSSFTDDIGIPGITDVIKSSIDPTFITLVLSTMMSEEARPVFEDVIMSKGEEFIRGYRRGYHQCTMNADCSAKLYAAHVETTLIVNVPQLYKQWRSTRKNPLQGAEGKKMLELVEKLVVQRSEYKNLLREFASRREDIEHYTNRRTTREKEGRRNPK